MRPPATQRQPLPGPYDLVVDEQIARLIRAKARRLARNHRLSHEDEDDLTQDFTVKALEVCSAFNPARANLKTFLSTVLDNHAAKQLRRRRAKRRSTRRIVSLHAAIARQGTDELELAQVVGQRELDARVGKHTHSDEDLAALGMDLAVVLAKAPPALRPLLEMLKAQPLAAVARAAGIPRSTLQARVRRLRTLISPAQFRGFW